MTAVSFSCVSKSYLVRVGIICLLYSKRCCKRRRNCVVVRIFVSKAYRNGVFTCIDGSGTVRVAVTDVKIFCRNAVYLLLPDDFKSVRVAVISDGIAVKSSFYIKVALCDCYAERTAFNVTAFQFQRLIACVERSDDFKYFVIGKVNRGVRIIVPFYFDLRQRVFDIVRSNGISERSRRKFNKHEAVYLRRFYRRNRKAVADVVRTAYCLFDVNFVGSVRGKFSLVCGYGNRKLG